MNSIPEGFELTYKAYQIRGEIPEHFGNEVIIFNFKDEAPMFPLRVVGDCIVKLLNNYVYYNGNTTVDSNIRFIIDYNNNCWISWGDYIFEHIGTEELKSLLKNNNYSGLGFIW
jgi:hypothetical protein